MYIQSQADFFFCSHLITGSFQQKVSGSVLQTFTGSSPQSVGIWTYSQILKINNIRLMSVRLTPTYRLFVSLHWSWSWQPTSWVRPSVQTSLSTSTSPSPTHSRLHRRDVISLHFSLLAHLLSGSSLQIFLVLFRQFFWYYNTRSGTLLWELTLTYWVTHCVASWVKHFSCMTVWQSSSLSSCRYSAHREPPSCAGPCPATKLGGGNPGTIQCPPELSSNCIK